MATIKDKITLAMLPSAQSGGVSTSTSDYSGTVYSLLPIQHESPNVVVNGGFDQDSDWIKDTGWTISNGVATYDNDGVAGNFRQNGFLEEGKTYILKFDTLETNGGNFGYTMGGSVVFINSIEANRTHQVKLVAESANLRLRAADNFAGSIDNVSVQLVSNGDFDFERSSSATRVGSDGYIKNVEVISDELVQNGDFEQIGSELLTNGDFEDGENGWNTGAGNFDIVNGKAVINHTNDTSVVVQNNVATVGKIYRVEFTISDYSEGRIRLRYPFINGDLENNPRNGTFVYYGEATDHRFELQSRFTEDANYKVDNISVKEVGQNWNFTSGSSFTENGIRIQSDGTYENFSQDNVMTVGKTYKVTYEVTEVNSGSIKFNTSFGLNSGVPSTLGVHSIYAIANISNLFFERTGVTDITIDNISVKEVTRDTDIPRLDFSNSAQPCLLLEPQRSNLITQSENIGATEWVNASPTRDITITQTSNTNPEGGAICWKIQGLNTNNQLAYVGSTTIGTTLTNSIYVKRISGTGDVQLRDVNNLHTNFSLSAADGWKRIDVTATATSTSARFYMNLTTHNDEILVWGAQQEEGSYPTSYIQTNGETNGVTRNKDKADNAGDNIIFNDEEGVLYAEIAALENSGSDRVFAIHNSSNTQEYINLRIDELANRFQMVVRSGGANSTTRGINVINSLEFNKVAVRYKQGESFRIFANGDFEEDTSSTGDPTPNGLNEMFFTANFEGKVRSILYFDKALTNEELIRLTSSDITQVLRNYNRRGELLGATYESAHVQTKLNELF